MTDALQQYNIPGWIALALVVIRELIPLARQYMPIKSRADAAKRNLELEDKRFEHEMKKREVEAQENIARLITIMDARLVGVEGDVKVIREDVGTVIKDVVELKRTRKAKS